MMVVRSEPDREHIPAARNIPCRYLTVALKNSGRLEIEGSEGGIDANGAISIDSSPIRALDPDEDAFWTSACLNQEVVLEMLAFTVEQGINAWIQPAHCHLWILP